VLHYLLYFVSGMAVGASGAARGVLAPDGPLSRGWLRWTGGTLLFFLLCFAVTILAFAQPQRPILWGTIGGLSFSLSCAASSFAALALLLRWTRRHSAALDSLRQNAYGIYLVHYFVVSWLQFALLGAAWPALVKGVVVFLGAVTVSWGLTAALRRIPGVVRVI
jgi:surface polysaccharide O-acyltransferase-like enzyme